MRIKKIPPASALLLLAAALVQACNTGSSGTAGRSMDTADAPTRSAQHGHVESRANTSSRGARISFLDHTFDIYTIAVPDENLRFFWKDDTGKKLKDFASLKKYVESKDLDLIFATNAGMYTIDNSPKGLHVENGKELVPIDLKTKQSNANFYMQPNGVFLLTKSGAKVVASQEFAPFRDSAVYATQSGPMLVINGAINSKFMQGSQNVYIRNGVGISRDGKVVFAISNELVNFYDFASLHKDKLNCDNALYLDGAISKMYLPEIGRYDLGGNFGGMIGVVR